MSGILSQEEIDQLLSSISTPHEVVERLKKLKDIQPRLSPLLERTIDIIEDREKDAEENLTLRVKVDEQTEALAYLALELSRSVQKIDHLEKTLKQYYRDN